MDAVSLEEDCEEVIAHDVDNPEVVILLARAAWLSCVDGHAEMMRSLLAGCVRQDCHVPVALAFMIAHFHVGRKPRANSSRNRSGTLHIRSRPERWMLVLYKHLSLLQLRLLSTRVHRSAWPRNLRAQHGHFEPCSVRVIGSGPGSASIAIR